MKKRVCVLFLIIAMLFTMVPGQVLAEDADDGESYESFAPEEEKQEAAEPGTAESFTTEPEPARSVMLTTLEQAEELPETAITSVKNVSAGVQVKWEDLSEAWFYTLGYFEYTGEEPEEDDYVWCDDTAATSYTISKSELENGSVYVFFVVAVFGDGDEDFSISDSEAWIYLTTPTVTKTRNVNAGVEVTWSENEYADSYTLMYKENGGSWKTAKSGVTSTKYTVPKNLLKNSTKYYFTVKAALELDDETIYSGYTSGKAQTYMAAPTVTKTRNLNAGVEVTWSKVSGATSYIIMYKKDGGSWSTLASGVTATKYVVPKAKLSSGTKYWFTVKAKGAATSGYTSGKAQTYITAPTVKSVSNTSSGVKVTWGSVTGAKTYTVMYKVSGGDWFTVKSGLTGTSYTVPKAKLTNGKTYAFTVKAVGAATSGYSSGKSLTYKAISSSSSSGSSSGSGSGGSSSSGSSSGSNSSSSGMYVKGVYLPAGSNYEVNTSSYKFHTLTCSHGPVTNGFCTSASYSFLVSNGFSPCGYCLD